MPSPFEPLTLRRVTFRNRLFMSPMCQYSARDGYHSDWHLVHYGARAAGGAGLVLLEATAVTPEGRISPSDLGLWDDDHVASLSRLASFAKSQGASAGVQLAHAGRKASTFEPGRGAGQIPVSQGGWKPLAPSALPFAQGDAVPAELTEEGIAHVIRSFAEAARRADHAGFDVVEVHAAHGYLLHEFLSPLTNRRTDRWGGSFENRTRLVEETVLAVRSTWPDTKPVFVRLSATDWKEPEGWTLDQTVALAKRLKALGADLIDVSSGGLVPDAKIPAAPLYQVPFAEKVKKEAAIAAGAVGLITEPAQIRDLLDQAQCDAVFLGRQLLREPNFPLRAAKELGVDVPWPLQYQRAKGH